MSYGAASVDLRGGAPWKRRALLLGLVAAAACVAAVGLMPEQAGAAELGMDWSGNPWAEKKLDHLGTWLHVRDVEVMPLPAYNADDDDSDSDHLAQSNLDDDDMQTPQLSARPSPAGHAKSAAAQQPKTDDLYSHKKHENPDVMGLKSLRNKILGQDNAKTKVKAEQDAIFAEAARKEAALNKSLQRQAVKKQAKQPHVPIAAPLLPHPVQHAKHVETQATRPLQTGQHAKRSDAAAEGKIGGKIRGAEAELSALKKQEHEQEVLLCLIPVCQCRYGVCSTTTCDRTHDDCRRQSKRRTEKTLERSKWKRSTREKTSCTAWPPLNCRGTTWAIFCPRSRCLK